MSILPPGLVKTRLTARYGRIWKFSGEINNGVLESELRRYGSNGSNYLVFYNSASVNSFQADVTVKAYENNGSYPHASLLGYAYKRDVGTE